MLYFTFIYLLIFVCFGPKLSKNKRIIFASLPMIIINFIRFGYGADYFSYQRIFNDMNMDGIKSAMLTNNGIEPLYMAMNYVARLIGMDYHLFAGIITSVIVIVTVVWLYKYSPKFEWSVLLYFSMHYSVWGLSALRQGLTMALIFYFIFSEKEYSKTIKVVVFALAMGIHVASIIIALIYLISKLKWKTKYFLALLLLIPFVRYILKPEFVMMFENISLMKPFAKYLTGDMIGFFSFTSLVRLFFFGVVVYHYDKLIEKYPTYVTMINFVVLSLVLYFFIPFSKIIATRVTVYGYFLTIVVFPMILTLYKKKPYKQVVTAGLAAFSLFSFYNEFDKMRDRSGYTGNLTQLNTVTIFNKDYNQFDKQFALHIQITENNRTDFMKTDVSDIWKQNGFNESVEYSPDIKNMAVVFPGEDKKGIINTKGEIVLNPKELSYLKVHDSIYEEQYKLEDGYKYSVFKSLTDNLEVNNQEAIDIVRNQNDFETERRLAKINKKPISKKELPEISLVSDYNMLPLIKIFLHEDPYSEQYNYLEIQTSYQRYFALLDKESNVVVDKWYNSITPADKNGIVIAQTGFAKEYINAAGEVFWIEPTNK